MSTLLIIEDNETNLKLVQFLLQRSGYTILSARDAEAGLVLAAESQPDLILIDIQLPGMDGLEATRRLKRDPATRLIPVVALTALAMQGDEARIRVAGCDGYIAKPIDYRLFLETVSMHLEQATMHVPESV